MATAVRYDEFGGVDVLRVDEVERPVAGDGQVLVRVKAAGINPLPGRAGPGRGRQPHAQTGEGLAGEAAGGLFVAGATAWGAVHAVQSKQGETVVIFGAAGGSARSPSGSRAVPGPRSSAW